MACQEEVDTGNAKNITSFVTLIIQQSGTIWKLNLGHFLLELFGFIVK